jgi:hypothetical protein
MMAMSVFRATVVVTAVMAVVKADSEVSRSVGVAAASKQVRGI